MALRIEDVDLATGRIHVRRSWDVVEGEIAPKSAKGDRSVPVAAVLRDHLDEHLMSLGWTEGLDAGQRGGGRGAARRLPSARQRRLCSRQSRASRVLIRPDSIGLHRTESPGNTGDRL
jgi:integrase